MIIEYIRYRIAPERADELEAAYRRAAAFVDSSPHCLRYEFARCTDEPGAVVVRIEWDSAEGHLSGFRRSREFRDFFQAVRPLVEAIEEMRHYDVKLAGGASVQREALPAPLSP